MISMMNCLNVCGVTGGAIGGSRSEVAGSLFGID